MLGKRTQSTPPNLGADLCSPLHHHLNTTTKTQETGIHAQKKQPT